MKRTAFTMIELVFVIVILGILAAVAIPKLSASRDDAYLSKALNDISTAVSDIERYYVANGKLVSNPTTMTNVIFDGNDLNSTVNYEVGSAVDCISFTIAAPATLTVANVGAPAAGSLCKKLQDSVSHFVKVYNFQGSGVTY